MTRDTSDLLDAFQEAARLEAELERTPGRRRRKRRRLERDLEEACLRADRIRGELVTRGGGRVITSSMGLLELFRERRA